jgi:hypothetical protein
MRRSAGFMTRNGRRRLVVPVKGPYISKVRRGRPNADRAENHTVREH